MQSIPKSSWSVVYALSSSSKEWLARDFYKAIAPAIGSVIINKIEQHGDVWIVMYTHRANRRIVDYRVSIVVEYNGHLFAKGDYVC